MPHFEPVPIASPSSYLDYLPALFREGETATEGNFVGRFLKISEKLLSGIHDGVVVPGPDGAASPGIEELLQRIHDFFDPLFTAPLGDSDAFVEYLGRWVALSLDAKWEGAARRRLLARIVPLYRRRGTRIGLEEYLRIFVGDNVRVEDFTEGIQVGETSTVGVDTFVGGLLPYFFIVTITFGEASSTIGFARDAIAATRAIVDLEKPAHTYYALRFEFPGIIVGARSTVGVNTIIGRTTPVFV